MYYYMYSPRGRPDISIDGINFTLFLTSEKGSYYYSNLPEWKGRCCLRGLIKDYSYMLFWEMKEVSPLLPWIFKTTDL